MCHSGGRAVGDYGKFLAADRLSSLLAVNYTLNVALKHAFNVS